jgi:dTDP-3-amino-3,4,6-trideoxy-alpha-D-glucose transaminase
MTFKLLECEKRTIIVPGFGAYPTVVAAIQAGAKKIIAAPIDNTLTLDLKNVDVPRDSIIVPVHLYGNQAEMSHLEKIAEDTNSIIVEDCAQSTGLEKSKKSFVAIHSFYPTKPLGCRGDGGAIISNDEKFISSCKKTRFYGLNDGTIESWGFNSRIDEWQAAHLISKISYYRSMNEKRKENAKKYSSAGVAVNYSPNCVFHQYVDIFSDRTHVVDSLNRSEIPTMIHYPKMLCDMPHLLDKVEFIECKRVSDHVLSFPVGPHLSASDVERISNSIQAVAGRRINFEDIL